MITAALWLQLVMLDCNDYRAIITAGNADYRAVITAGNARKAVVTLQFKDV